MKKYLRRNPVLTWFMLQCSIKDYRVIQSERKQFCCIATDADGSRKKYYFWVLVDCRPRGI